MLHVILLILKILLWIVLGLVSLVLLLLLLILFAPITYRADIKLDDNASVAARVRFLILSVRLDFDKNAKIFETGVRVCGIKLGRGKKSVREVEDDVQKLPQKTDELVNGEIESEEDTIEDTDTKHSEDSKDIKNTEEKQNTADNEIRNEISDEKQTEQDNEAIEEAEIPDDEAYRKDGKASHKKKKTKKKKKEKNKEEENNKEKESGLNSLSVKLEAIKKKLNRIGRFWDLPCTVKLRAYLKKYIPGLLRHISPRKIEGHVRYGLNEPCKTGQVTGYLSLMPFVYQKGFYMEPDFYNKVLEGEVKLKGRLMLGYILRIVLNI
ncbi:MAG: DUF2953 domain-containing protein, partial [Lachnospiraceae bacterium]|nr:DUF2953 domain-containing protein [Lachnospiraceae bacterium]